MIKIFIITLGILLSSKAMAAAAVEPSTEHNHVYQIDSKLLDDVRDHTDLTQENEIQEFATFIAPLLQDVDNISERSCIIRSAYEIPADVRLGFIEFVKPLLSKTKYHHNFHTNHWHTNHWHAIIDAAAEIDVNARSGFVEFVAPLLQDVDNINERSSIIRSAYKIPADLRIGFIEFVKSLIQNVKIENPYSDNGRDKIIDVAAEIDVNARSGFVEFVAPLLQDVNGISDRAKILRIAYKIPADVRIGFIEFAKSLIQNVLVKSAGQSSDITQLIETAAQVDVNSRPGFVEFVTHWLRELQKIPYYAEYSIIESAVRKNNRIAFSSESFVEAKYSIIKAAVQVPVDRRTGFVEFIMSLLQSFQHATIPEIIKTLAKVDVNARRDFVEFVTPLLQGEKDLFVVRDMIVAALTIPADARNSFAQFAKPLLESTDDISVRSRIIISALAVSVNERKDFMGFIETLLQSTATPKIRCTILEASSQIPVNTRKKFVNFVMPLLQSIHYNHRDIIYPAFKMPAANYQPFLQFVRENNAQDFQHIIDLLQVHNARDWPQTWAGIQRQHRGTRATIQEVANQTAHDDATEIDIIVAVTKLRSRYQSATATTFSIPDSTLATLAGMIDYLRAKATALNAAGKLSADELRVIQANFNNSLNLADELRVQLFDYLKLTVQALLDRAATQEMIRHAPSDIEMDDRLASWFKSAIVDSQLAYRRDRGDTSFPTDEELNDDKSCFGGNLNRIIMALNLVHPDVTIKEGQGTLANMEVYKKAREEARFKQFIQNDLAKVAHAFLKSIATDELRVLLIDAKAAFDLDDADALARLQPLINNLTSAIKQAALSYFKPDGDSDVTSGKNKPMVERFQPQLDTATKAYIEGLPDYINLILESQTDTQRTYQTNVQHIYQNNVKHAYQHIYHTDPQHAYQNHMQQVYQTNAQHAY